jgi:hypothetical protein
MNSSYPSFLSENSNRAFPFIENSYSDKLSNDCFIDFRCWTRFKVHQTPSLYLVANGIPNISDRYNQFLKDGFCNIFFLIHKVPENEHIFNGMICVSVPLDNSVWPYLATSSFWNTSGTKMFELKTLVNSSVLEVANNENSYLFLTNIFGESNENGIRIEPSQVVYSGGIVIDELKVLNISGEQKRLVSGDINILPGFNTTMYQQSNKITINSSINIGVGKKYNYEKNEICNGVFSINGVSPDESGNFSITGENGVMIFNLPEEYKIIIAIDPKTKIAKCQA